MDELEARLQDDLRSAAGTVVAGESLDAAVDAGRKQRARRQRVLMTGAAVVAVLAVVVGVVAFTGDEPTAVETVGDPPAEDIWSVTSPAPIEPRLGFVSTWTGEEMLVWGGRAPDDGDLAIYDNGAAYDPDTDTWRVLPPAPIDGRTQAVSAWTGTEWLILGGIVAPEAGGPGDLPAAGSLSSDIAAYDPDSDTWRTAEFPFGIHDPDVDMVATPAGTIVAVKAGPDAALASNMFLISIEDLSVHALPPISGSGGAVAWPGGSTVYVSGYADQCRSCLWEVPIETGSRPDDPSPIPPMAHENWPFPKPPLLWADGLLVGLDTIYDPAAGARNAPRRTRLELTNPVWTGSLIVGTSLTLEGDPPFATLQTVDGDSSLGSLPLTPPVDVAESGEQEQVWWQYDPHAGTVLDLPASPDERIRRGAQSVWTGEEVIIWGGAHCDFECVGGPGAPVAGLRLRPPPFPSVDSPTPPTTLGSTVPTTVDDGSTPPETDTTPTIVTTSVPPTSEPSDDIEEVTLAAAGTSFGMCGGYCQMTLTFTGTTVELVAMGWPVQPGGAPSPEWSTQATLTSEAVTLIGLVLMELDTDALEETYGCPDCADGGAAWVELETPEGLMRSTYDYGGPPEHLDPLDLLMGALLDSITICEDSEYLIIDPGCTPLPDP